VKTRLFFCLLCCFKHKHIFQKARLQIFSPLASPGTASWFRNVSISAGERDRKSVMFCSVYRWSFSVLLCVSGRFSSTKTVLRFFCWFHRVWISHSQSMTAAVCVCVCVCVCWLMACLCSSRFAVKIRPPPRDSAGTPLPNTVGAPLPVLTVSVSADHLITLFTSPDHLIILVTSPDDLVTGSSACRVSETWFEIRNFPEIPSSFPRGSKSLEALKQLLSRKLMLFHFDNIFWNAFFCCCYFIYL